MPFFGGQKNWNGYHETVLNEYKTKIKCNKTKLIEDFYSNASIFHIKQLLWKASNISKSQTSHNGNTDGLFLIIFVL